MLLSLLVSERNMNSGPESYPSLTEELHKIQEESYMPENRVHALLLVQMLLVSKKSVNKGPLNPPYVPNFNV